MTGFLDTPSRVAEPFWLAVTGWTLSARRDGGTFATLVPGAGDACLRVQVTGGGPVGAHVDLHVDDVAAAAVEAAGLGAVVIGAVDGLVVLRSPAGISFCLVPWCREWERPVAARWTGGQRSVVDQLCLDVPGSVFDGEAGFWGSLTGWDRVPTDLPDFSYFRRPSGLAIRLLMQRVGGDTAGVHVDFACDDVDAEVSRHVGCGAVVVRRVEGDWVTLRDPAGREYCVTGRSPHS